MATLTYFYESSLYSKNFYTPFKYGLVQAFGFGSLICFALAYLFLAMRIGWAMIYNSVPIGSKMCS